MSGSRSSSRKRSRGSRSGSQVAPGEGKVAALLAKFKKLETKGPASDVSASRRLTGFAEGTMTRPGVKRGASLRKVSGLPRMAPKYGQPAVPAPPKKEDPNEPPAKKIKRALGKLDADSALGAAMVRRAAFFDTEHSIPKTLWRAPLAGGSAEDMDAAELAIQAFKLVEVSATDGSVKLSPVVKEVVTEQGGPEYEAMCEQAVDALRAVWAFKAGQEATYEDAKALETHMFTTLHTACGLGVRLSWVSDLAGLHGLGGFYKYIDNDFESAESWYKMCLNLVESLNDGSDDAAVANALNNLGVLYDDYDQSEDARAIYERMLALSYIAPDHVKNMAAHYYRAGDHEKASQLYQQALDARKANGESKTAEYAADTANLAYVLETMGKADKAIPLYEESLEVTGATEGKESAAYAETLFGMGQALTSLDKAAEAIGKYEEGLAIRKKLFGDDDKGASWALRLLSDAQRTAKDYDGALKTLERAKELDVKFDDDAAAARDDVFRARVFLAQGKSADGVPLVEAAMKMYKKVFGKEAAEDHMFTAEAKELLKVLQA